jgi:polyketide cyclase/dehydrase/lipid transport protein
MSHLSATLAVDAPATAVFDLIADPSRSPEWQTLLVEMGPISGRSGGIGSSYLGFYRVAGRKLASRFVVTAAVRPSLLQVNGTTTGGWTRWTTAIEPEGDRSTLRISLDYELPGEIVGSLFGMLTGNRIEREFRRSYDQLKRLVESNPAGRSTGPAEQDRTPHLVRDPSTEADVDVGSATH